MHMLVFAVRRLVPTTFVSISIYLHDISKTNAAMITKLDVEMFHYESYEPIYFGVKRSRS